MVGRTPEYLGKKVEAREMKLAMLAMLIHPLLILRPTGLFAATDWGQGDREQPRPARLQRDPLRVHARPRPTTARASRAWRDNNPRLERRHRASSLLAGPIAPALVMLLGRFMPIIAAAGAGRRAWRRKKPTPFTTGTLRTDTLTFGVSCCSGRSSGRAPCRSCRRPCSGPVAEHLRAAAVRQVIEPTFEPRACVPRATAASRRA